MNEMVENGEPWSPQKSAQLYQIQGWGLPYFSVSDEGHVQVAPDPTRPRNINLFELVQQVDFQLVRPPVAVGRAAACGVIEGALGFGCHRVAFWMG